MKRVAVVMPNFNSWWITKKNISLLKMQEGIKFDIIVIDDCSTDKSEELLSKVRGIKLLKNKANMGASASYNLGIRFCMNKKYDYIILTDNDAFPCSKKLIKKLVIAADKRKGSAFILPTLKTDKTPKEGRVSCGAFHFFTLPKQIIRKIGMIDEKYFIQVDDLDYSTRITNAGYSGWKIKEKYTHPEKRTSWISPNFVYYTIRNSLYYNSKFNSGINQLAGLLKIKLKIGVINSFSKIKGLILERVTSLAVEDYSKKRMGKRNLSLSKSNKNSPSLPLEKYDSPRELYLSLYKKNRRVYYFKILRALLK